MADYFSTKSLQKYVTLKEKLNNFTNFFLSYIVKTTANFLNFIFVNIQDKRVGLWEINFVFDFYFKQIQLNELNLKSILLTILQSCNKL